MGTGTEIRVLHVDDEAEFADLTSSFLEQEDSRITVETATSANEGLDRLGQDGYDCIVSDYNMPGQTGVQFLDAVRKEHPDLPFILFTGKGSEEIASEAISAGVTDYLQKGSKAEQYELLANRIQNAVDACRTKQLVRERTRRLETLIGNLPGMVYRCKNKQQWPMETVEGEVERLTGYSSDTLEGNEVLWGEEIIHPEDRETMWEAVQDGLSERGVFEVTYRITTKGGTTKWMWERGRGIYAEDGELEALEGFITDITERKEREKELARQSERLETVMNVVSDDLQAPLTVAESHLKRAHNECDNDHLVKADNAVGQSLTLIDDLLAMAQKGRAVSDSEPIDLHDTAQNCWQNVETGNATLNNRANQTIRADPSQIESLLENLIENAVEHSSGDPNVAVGELDDGFYVEDDGPGIPKSERDDVFDAGYSTTDASSGFGLSIVEQVAQAHGWEVTVTSGREGGARFEVTGVEFDDGGS